MSQADDITRWIRGLANPDPAKRLATATQLKLVASTLCQSAINEWNENLEFRELLLPFLADAAGKPNHGKTPFVTGIAVQPDNFEQIRTANGSPRLADVPPDQDALEFELRFGDHADFDILTTREPGGSGVIARYLQKFGEGIQQIEILATNVDRATEILGTQFHLAPIYPATRAGADGTRVNFFLAAAPGNKRILIEIVEAKARES
jgi:hypothetical protein